MMDRVVNVLFTLVVSMLVMDLLAQEGLIGETDDDRALYSQYKTVIKKKGYLR